MVEKTLVVRNRLGLHARPAALLAQVASRFRSAVWVSKDATQVNGKSVMGLMMLAAENGSHLKITTDGADEQQAMAGLENLFEGKFEEE